MNEGIDPVECFKRKGTVRGGSKDAPEIFEVVQSSWPAEMTLVVKRSDNALR